MKRERILYLQYTNPGAYPALEHSARMFARSGWGVLFLGTGAFGANSLEIAKQGGIASRRIRYCPPGFKQKLHYVWFSLWACAWTLWWRPSRLYASDPLSCPVALLLGYLPGLRLVYHEHDSPSGVLGHSIKQSEGEEKDVRLAPATTSLSWFMRLTMQARRRVVHRAGVCIVPNARRVETLPTRLEDQEKVKCVWNCAALDEVSIPRSDWDGETLWVLYQGSIVPPRLPMSIVEAFTKLPPHVKLRIVGYETAGHQGYLDRLTEMAARNGVDTRLQIVGALPRDRMLEWCRRSDIGLSLIASSEEDFNLRTIVGASVKPFDYLASGLPVLVPDLPEWRELYVEPGYGLTCDPEDSESIAESLQWFLEHPKEMRAMGERGRRRVACEWNYERQFEPVFRELSGHASLR